TSTLKPLDQLVYRVRHVMQLHRHAERSRMQTQRVPLTSHPSAPFDDHRQPLRKKFLGKLPLERLNLCADLGTMQVDGESVEPVVGGKTNRSEFDLERPGQSSLARSRQAAHDD